MESPLFRVLHGPSGLRCAFALCHFWSLPWGADSSGEKPSHPSSCLGCDHTLLPFRGGRGFLPGCCTRPYWSPVEDAEATIILQLSPKQEQCLQPTPPLSLTKAEATVTPELKMVSGRYIRSQYTFDEQVNELNLQKSIAGYIQGGAKIVLHLFVWRIIQ